MEPFFKHFLVMGSNSTFLVVFGIFMSGILTACATLSPGNPEHMEFSVQSNTPVDSFKLLNRLTWGVNSSSARQLAALGNELRSVQDAVRDAWATARVTGHLKDSIPAGELEKLQASARVTKVS